MEAFKERGKEFLLSHKIESVFLGICLLMGIVSAILFVNLQADRTNRSPLVIQQNHTESQDTVVDIGGAVVKPGVYHVKSGQRIYELVDKAGGLSEDADLAFFDKTINRAQKLNDQTKIYIPFKNMEKLMTSLDENISPLISLNSATSAELETLAGVGSVTAKKIIDNRPYSTLDELLNKKILNSKVYAEIKTLITL